MTALVKNRRPLAALVGVFTCGMLAGCGADNAGAGTSTPAGIPSTTPALSSTPTVSTSPSTTGAPSATAASASASSSGDLARQAEAIYRQRFALYVAAYKAGGIAPGTPAPAAFKALMTDRALADTMNELGQIETLGLHYKSGSFDIKSVAPSTKQMAGSVVALQSCEDGRTLVSQNPKGVVSRGRLVAVTSYYTRVGGQLKMMYYFGAEASTCDGH